MILSFDTDLSDHLESPIEIAKRDGEIVILASPCLQASSSEYFSKYEKELKDALYDGAYLIGCFDNGKFYMHYGGTVTEGNNGIEVTGYRVYDTLSRCFRGSMLPNFIGLVGTDRDGNIFLNDFETRQYYMTNAREAITY